MAEVVGKAAKLGFQLRCLDFKLVILDFPGGAVVKNPPANAGDTG